MLFACGEHSHIYEGRLYRSDRDCLGTTSSVDVVSGEAPAACPPTCLAQAHADGGRSIYVATMCAPYPFDFDASGSDPMCPNALEALARNDTCRADGSSTAPRPNDASAD